MSDRFDVTALDHCREYIYIFVARLRECVCVCQLAYSPKPCSMMWHCWLVLTLRLFKGGGGGKKPASGEKELAHQGCVCVCRRMHREKKETLQSVYSTWVRKVGSFDVLNCGFCWPETCLSNAFCSRGEPRGIGVNKRQYEHTNKDGK